MPYPNTLAGKWQVSSNGGVGACWRGDSRELYFLGADSRVYAVSFAGNTPQPQMAAPQPLFAIPNPAYSRAYEASPDGKRFLVNRVPEQVSTPVSLLLNWTEELKGK